MPISLPCSPRDEPLLHDVRGRPPPRRLAPHGGELDQGSSPEGAPHAGGAPPDLARGSRRVHGPPRHAVARRPRRRGARPPQGARHRRGGARARGDGAPARGRGLRRRSGVPGLRGRCRRRAFRAGRGRDPRGLSGRRRAAAGAPRGPRARRDAHRGGRASGLDGAPPRGGLRRGGRSPSPRMAALEEAVASALAGGRKRSADGGRSPTSAHRPRNAPRPRTD